MIGVPVAEDDRLEVGGPELQDVHVVQEPVSRQAGSEEERSGAPHRVAARHQEIEREVDHAQDLDAIDLGKDTRAAIPRPPLTP